MSFLILTNVHAMEWFVHSESSLPAVSQDSVCRLLMRVQPIQPLLVTFLLSKLTEHSDEEIAPTFSSSNSFLNALLNQLRWTDFLADASPLVSGLLETLAVRLPRGSDIDLLAVAAAGIDSAAARLDS